MRKLPIIVAAATTLFAFPALAGQSQFGQPQGGLGGKTYGYDRESDMRQEGQPQYGQRQYGQRQYGEEGWRRPRAEFFREGCKYITVRQRRGDEIVVRRFKRCD
jgi:hypothetical protein